jgi:putative membrane protein
MLPIAAALTLALAAGCDRRANETTGSTRTTSATPSQQDDMLRDAAGSMGMGTPGTPDRTGTMGTTGTPDRTGTMGTTGMNDTSGAAGTTTTTGAAAAALDEHDKDFITKAASGSMAEIALGTAASQKATMPDVKSLANRMVADHSKASDELKSLAAKKGVTLPTEMAREPKSEQDKLMKLSGHQFDKEYADFMVKDHEQDLKDFQKAAKDAKDPDVKSWAAKMVPILQEHLNTAKQIDAKVKH